LRALLAGAALLTLAAASPPAAGDFAADAREIDRLIAANYAYLDRFPGATLPDTPALIAERGAVSDAKSLLRYAEHRIASLADHHAITGRSFADSWAVVPSYSDLWIDAAYRITAVKPGSPAERAGIVAGDALAGVDGVPTAQAVAAFWAPIGLSPDGERAAYAARVLAAGRRDRPRALTIRHGEEVRTLTLASLYADRPVAAPVSVSGNTIRINNSLGDAATVTAFDTAMAALPDRAPVTIDLTDTPSGGNTSVARGIMGWFVDRPTSYQLHQLPSEERETGIARQWIEQVLPRGGKHHAGRVTVRVGRWTGSMGEGLAIGLAATGARLCGGPMAGLRGAVYDYTLPASGLRVTFPAERLYTVSGVPRENVTPPACR
jgi:hypothetical protein